MRHLEAIEKMKKFKPDEITLVICALLNEGKIDFIEIIKLYVYELERERKERRGAISVLGLMLASYCIHDASPGGKNARKHLYESGAFGHDDGSQFGKLLDDEFKDEPPTVTNQFLGT